MSVKEQRLTASSRIIQIVFLLVLLIAWAIVGKVKVINAVFLPSPDQVALRFLALLETGELYSNLTVTISEFVFGFALAASAGLAVGFLVGRSAFATVLIEPFIAGLFSIPIVIFMPLFILFFGLGPASKIAFGAVYAFFPIALNTISGVTQVDRNFVRVGVSMGATEMQMFRRIYLPGSLPIIVNGLRIGCVLCFLAVLGSETIAGLSGLGTAIAKSSEAMNTAEMFAYILFVILLAALLNAGLSWAQKRLSPPTRS